MFQRESTLGAAALILAGLLGLFGSAQHLGSHEAESNDSCVLCAFQPEPVESAGISQPEPGTLSEDNGRDQSRGERQERAPPTLHC